MMEYNITDTVLLLMVGMALGLGLIFTYMWWVVSRFESRLRGHIQEAVSRVNEALMPVIVEQEGEEIYVYSQEDRQFLVQGRTAKEIRERFDQRFPDRIAYMAGGDEALIERLRGELKQLKEQEKSEVSHSI